MERRRILLACDQLVPPKYRRLEYVDTDGTKYINTGVIPSNDIGFDVDFMAYSQVSNTTNQYGCIFGSRYASGNNDCQFTTYIDSSTTSWGGTLRFGPNTVSKTRNAGITRNTRQQTSLHSRSFKNAAGTTASVDTYSWTSSARPIYLFGLNNNNSFTQAGSGCRIYSAKFYNGSTLVRNYIPCIGKAGKGLYEAVSGVFQPLNTSGVPPTYEQLEYIETDGTKYINTGVTPSNNIGFDITFLTNNVFDANNGYGCIMGGRAGSGNNDFQLTTFNNTYTNYNGTLRFGTGDDGTKSKNAGITHGEVCTASLRNRSFTNAAGTTYSLSTYNWNNAKPIYLFGLNNGGTFGQAGQGCRIYSAKFYNSTTLVRNYTPCRRRSDNVIGMYDSVNDTFNTLT